MSFPNKCFGIYNLYLDRNQIIGSDIFLHNRFCFVDGSKNLYINFNIIPRQNAQQHTHTHTQQQQQ